MKVSASWTLGFIVDALFWLFENDKEAYEEYPKHCLIKLLELSSSMAESVHNNICLKVNSLRTLGCLLHQFDQDLLNHPNDIVKANLEDLCLKSVSIVEQNMRQQKKTNVMKVRWNACYAASRIVQNKVLENLTNNFEEIINSVLDVLTTCNNFKVQTNAVSVLLKIQDRSVFGRNFDKIITTLFESLEKADQLQEESNESQHKMDLTNNICLALAYLMSFCSKSDVSSLKSELLSCDRLEMLKNIFTLCLRNLSPEKASQFIRTTSHLRAICPNEIELIDVFDN